MSKSLVVKIILIVLILIPVLFVARFIIESSILVARQRIEAKSWIGKYFVSERERRMSLGIDASPLRQRLENDPYAWKLYTGEVLFFRDADYNSSIEGSTFQFEISLPCEENMEGSFAVSEYENFKSTMREIPADQVPTQCSSFNDRYK